MQSEEVAPDWKDLEAQKLLGVGRVRLVLHKPTGATYALKAVRKHQVVATKQERHIVNKKKILAR